MLVNVRCSAVAEPWEARHGNYLKPRRKLSHDGADPALCDCLSCDPQAVWDCEQHITAVQPAATPQLRAGPILLHVNGLLGHVQLPCRAQSMREMSEIFF
jgi:hypothetical protein